MDEARLQEIEAGHQCKAGSGCVLMDLVAGVRLLQAENEDNRRMRLANGTSLRHCAEELAEARARVAEAEGEYEQIRDAVLTHLALFAHDGDEPEPMIMVEAIKDAGEALGDLRWDEDAGELVSDERERLRDLVAAYEEAECWWGRRQYEDEEQIVTLRARVAELAGVGHREAACASELSRKNLVLVAESRQLRARVAELEKMEGWLSDDWRCPECGAAP